MTVFPKLDATNIRVEEMAYFKRKNDKVTSS